MLPFDLAQEFKKRAQRAMPFPRGAVSFQASAVNAIRSSNFGLVASLGAIGLGGLMMLANFAHEKASPALAVAAPAVTEKASEPAKPPLPLASEAAAQTVPIAAPVVTKSTTRVDMSATGAIEKPQAPKMPLKSHKAKKKQTAKSQD